LQIGADYAKFEQFQVIWIISIVVLAHKLRPAIFLRERCQSAKLVFHSCSLQHLLLHLLAFLIDEALDFAHMIRTDSLGWSVVCQHVPAKLCSGNARRLPGGLLDS
jgi:hypothetical protein